MVRRLLFTHIINCITITELKRVINLTLFSSLFIPNYSEILKRVTYLYPIELDMYIIGILFIYNKIVEKYNFYISLYFSFNIFFNSITLIFLLFSVTI